jgi:ribosomal protein L37AE/L43A
MGTWSSLSLKHRYLCPSCRSPFVPFVLAVGFHVCQQCRWRGRTASLIHIVRES